MDQHGRELHGGQRIGAETSADGTKTFTATDPRTGSALPGVFHEATRDEVDRALALAWAAHRPFEDAGRERRAAFLERIAADIEALGDPLLERASAETALPLARLTGERARACGQLRLFAAVIRDGSYLDCRIERADPERKPLPKPDVRAMRRALGPVAVFGASNFPLAFSVAGGDTAAALAAGCPVVAKAHPAHPGTSAMVAEAILAAVEATGMPDGTFSMVHGTGHEVGLALVEHPLTRAVGFTGSLAGGRALFDAAARRPEPIPVYAEMGSTNPGFALPAKLAADGPALASALAASITMGVGQFCTSPGLVFARRDPATEAFVAHLAKALAASEEGTLLHAGIRKSFDARLAAVSAVPGVTVVHRGTATSPCGARPALLTVDERTWRAHPTLTEEIFGPATLIVLCDDHAQMVSAALHLPGQLTATLHAAPEDLPAARDLLAILEQRAGRVLFGGMPTGVDVSPAMVHGGPYPATTDSRTTSVGTMAIERFVRPVAWQSFPQELLPEELRDDAPEGLWRMVDGVRRKG